SVQLGPKCFERLPRSLEAQLTWHHIVALCGFRHHCTDQIVYQEVRPYLLADHIRRLAPQHIHSQRLLDRSYVELCMPPGTVKPLKLVARVHFRVEQACNDHKLIGPETRLVDPDPQLTHQKHTRQGGESLAAHPLPSVTMSVPFNQVILAAEFRP